MSRVYEPIASYPMTFGACPVHLTPLHVAPGTFGTYGCMDSGCMVRARLRIPGAWREEHEWDDLRLEDEIKGGKP